ncbi:MAG: VOC family protein [Actinomycetota bacterium]|nr:VOC family protein [Actinomycetota bacterium]
MRLEGIHHITAITGNAPRNVNFYAGTLGLRLVKKSVNQDDPTVYHLFYADEKGSPGSDLTFFEYPGASPGRAGAGMIHRITWRVRSEDALSFWDDRLASVGTTTEREPGSLRFRDPEGLDLELKVVDAGEEPLIADHPEVPKELALQGFDSVRAFTFEPEDSATFLREAVGFEQKSDEEWMSRGENRSSSYFYDTTRTRGISGAGTVHHVAWACRMDEHAVWRERVVSAGAHVTPVIDRFYFRSIYFREPSGVLFEIATIGPGFAVDEPAELLGQSLSLPPDYEPLRERLEKILTPLPDPRAHALARRR